MVGNYGTSAIPIGQTGNKPPYPITNAQPAYPVWNTQQAQGLINPYSNYNSGYVTPSWIPSQPIGTPPHWSPFKPKKQNTTGLNTDVRLTDEEEGDTIQALMNSMNNLGSYGLDYKLGQATQDALDYKWNNRRTEAQKALSERMSAQGLLGSSLAEKAIQDIDNAYTQGKNEEVSALQKDAYWKNFSTALNISMTNYQSELNAWALDEARKGNDTEAQRTYETVKAQAQNAYNIAMQSLDVERQQNDAIRQAYQQQTDNDWITTILGVAWDIGKNFIPGGSFLPSSSTIGKMTGYNSGKDVSSWGSIGTDTTRDKTTSGYGGALQYLPSYKSPSNIPLASNQFASVGTVPSLSTKSTTLTPYERYMDKKNQFLI